MTQGPVLLWVRRPPHSTVHLAEAIRVAAMGTALDVPIRMLFIADGVRSLVRTPDPFRFDLPVEKALADIVTVDRPALVHLPSLIQRGIDRTALLSGVPVEPVSTADAADWVMRASQVVPF